MSRGFVADGGGRQYDAPPGSTFVIRLTFTQGFLAGQLSVIIIALFAVRYFIFEDSRLSKQRARRPSALPVRLTKNRKGGSILGGMVASSSKEGGLSTAGGGAGAPGAGLSGSRKEDVAQIMESILAKVEYEMDSHAGETIDWVNVIFAQALAGYRQDIAAGGWASEADSSSTGKNGKGTAQDTSNGGAASGATNLQRTARDWMEEILNVNTVGRGMSFLDPIQVTHVEFGDSYPILSNAKVRPADDMGRMRVEFDVDYTDCISLAIETKLLINLPRPRFAVLPISLGLTIERFSGTLAIELFSNEASSSVVPKARSGSGAAQAPSPPPRSRHELHFSLHPDFALDASATSLVGSRAKLQDLPKIEQLLVGRVRSFIHDRFVWPKYWTLTLPNLIPRHVNRPNEASQEEKTDMGINQGRGVMDVHGPGDALLDEKHAHRDENGMFFETAPPLFPGMPHQGHPREHALPGALPAVEAWRSHAAAKKASGMAGAGAAGSHAGSAYDGSLRLRSGGAVGAGRPAMSSRAMSSTASANAMRVHHSELRNGYASGGG